MYVLLLLLNKLSSVVTFYWIAFHIGDMVLVANYDSGTLW